MKNDTSTQLRQLAHKFKHLHFNTLTSPERAEKFSLQVDGLYLNYSRNPLNDQVMTCLLGNDLFAAPCQRKRCQRQNRRYVRRGKNQ